MSASTERARERAFPPAHEGLAALEAHAETPNLNRWYFESLADGIRGQVLEVGAGIGNLSALIAPAADHLVVSDMDPEHVAALERRFAGNPRVEVVPYRLGGPMPEAIAGRRFDAVVSLNVIEHVADDLGAVRALAERLEPGGHLLSYVPAGDWAYGSLDRYLHHYRRYSRSRFARLMESAGLEVTRIEYLNAIGIAGWLVNGRLFRRTTLSARQTRLFDRAIPLVRRLERRPPPLGLGLICHARKP